MLLWAAVIVLVVNLHSNSYASPSPISRTEDLISTEDVEAVLSNPTPKREFIKLLYKRCYVRCTLAFKSRLGGQSLLQLAREGFSEQDHEKYCASYNETRKCVRSCALKESQMVYIRPFFRKNYLNEMLCVKHYEEFRRFLPCYMNEHKSLEHFLIRCGYFALDDRPSIDATRTTCVALSCVLRAIPQTIRRECENPAAAEFMKKIVGAFLRDRIRLNVMIERCKEKLS